MRWIFLLIVLTIFKSTQIWTTSEDVDDLDEAIVEDEYDETQSNDEIKYESPKSSKNHFYFSEHFDNVKKFEKKWIKSEATKEGIDADIAKYDGQWNVEAPQRDRLKGDLGLVLKSKAKHAAISALLDHPFEFKSRSFIVQYEVTLQEGQECGGAYLKLLTHEPNLNLKQFHDKTPYTIMFGPDKCGNDHKLHFIFRHKNPINGTISEKHCKKPKDRLDEIFTDKLPHLYRLTINPDNTFQIHVDNKLVNDGSLLEDFTPPVNPPSEIDDPTDHKPEDWDDRETIPDPDAVKPDDWDEDAPRRITDPNAVKPSDWLDNEQSLIPDTNAKKPDDWDTEMDGEWEPPLIPNPVCSSVSGCGEWKPPQIDNPNYKGKWRAPLVSNPAYKGKWKAHRIPNPDYYYDDNPYEMNTIGAVGFELWSMSANILIDNIIITDDPKIAADWASKTFELKRLKIDKDAESLWTRMLRYSHDNPWVWAVVVLVVGLPFVLIIFFCCSSSKDKDDIGKIKKTDGVTPEDIIEEVEENEVDNQKEEKNNDNNIQENNVEDELAEGDTEKSSPKPSNKSSLEQLNESDDENHSEMDNNDEASGDSVRRRQNVGKTDKKKVDN